LVAAGANAYRGTNYAEAVNTLEKAVPVAREHLARTDVLRSQALTGLAEALTGRGSEADLERAVALSKEALEADETRTPVTDESVATLADTLSTLAIAYHARGELGLAEPVMRRALKLRTQVFGEENPRTAESLANLGTILYDGGSFA